MSLSSLTWRKVSLCFQGVAKAYGNPQQKASKPLWNDAAMRQFSTCGWGLSERMAAGAFKQG